MYYLRGKEKFLTNSEFDKLFNFLRKVTKDFDFIIKLFYSCFKLV